MQYQTLMDHCVPELYGMVLSCTEQFQPVMPVGLYYGIELSGKYVGQMLHLESFRKGLDEFYDHGHLLLPVKLLLRMQAVVACTAVLHLIILSEIVQQQLSSARIGFCICHCLHQQLPAYLLLCDRFALHEFLKFLYVLVAVERYALPLASVSSGAPGLLIIAFDTFRNIVMDDKSHIRFVYAHAERYGSNDDIYLLHQELVLVLRPCPGIKPCMVRSSLDAVDVQQFCQFLHLFPAQTVYDAGFARILSDISDYIFLRVRLVPYFIIQV